LMMPVVAQQNFRATAKHPAMREPATPATNCMATTHSHRYSDMRLAVIEIASDDTCGFDYINLEDNTVGPDNHFQYSDDFIVARAASLTPEAQTIQSDVLTRKSIHKGTRGIAIYCGICKAIVMLKIVEQ
jgi:hypothetical protein